MKTETQCAIEAQKSRIKASDQIDRLGKLFIAGRTNESRISYAISLVKFDCLLRTALLGAEAGYGHKVLENTLPEAREYLDEIKHHSKLLKRNSIYEIAQRRYANVVTRVSEISQEVGAFFAA